MSTESRGRSYRFEPTDTSGIFLGLGIVQCVLLGGGMTVAVLALTAGLPPIVAAVPVVLAAVASFARVRGYAAWEWIGLGAGWVTMRLGRGPRWYPRLALHTAAGDQPAPLPPCLAALSIVEVPWRGRLRMGAVVDQDRHTLTGLVRVSGPQFVVEPHPEQERLLAGWGDVLNQFAVERGTVIHLSWSDFASPSGLAEHRAWLSTRDTGATHPDAAASYRDLLAEAAGAATAHDVVLNVTVSRDRLPRRRGSTDPHHHAARALVSAMEALLRALRTAGLTASDPLGATDLQRLLRVRSDPPAARPRLRGGQLVERLGLVTSASAGPLAVVTSWRHLRVDGAFHRTYTIASWPRLAVPPGWLEPFLASGGVTRTVTVYFAPVPAHQSRRRIERDLVKLESDAATKEEKGRRVDARHRRATQALLDREDELVAGYAEVGYAGLVTVSAPTLEELEDHSEIVEQLAREAGMELRCLDGRQDVGWAACLPLGLAPRTLLS